MKLTKKFRYVCTSLLAACCLGAAATGFAVMGAVHADAAAANGWTGGSREGEVTVCTDAVSIRSEVDILSLPGKTGIFYMYQSDGKEWSGFSLRNGNAGVGYSWILMENQGGEQVASSKETFPWHSLCFDGTNNHMILQDNREFTTGGTLGGLHGTEKENFLDGMIPVEIHIGEGTAKNDPSYVKIGGVELTNEDNETNITQPWTRGGGTSKELVSTMFPQGCYVVINYNIGSNPTHEFALSDVGSITSANATMDKTATYQYGAFGKDLSLDISSPEDVFDSGYQVVAKVNGKALPAESVTVEVKDNKSATVSIPEAKLNAIAKEDLKASTYFTFHVSKGETEYGYAVVSTNIRFEDAPQFTELDKTLTEKASFSYEFTYSGSEDPLNGIAISYAVGKTGGTLTAGTDFTVAKVASADDKYTITITQSGVDKIFFSGHTTSTVTIALGPHTVRSSVFIDGQITEEGIRFRSGIDYIDNTLHIDEFYASATIKKHNPETLSSRIFYEKPVDVSEPIFIEYGTLDPRVDWLLISLMSSPKISETFSNDTGVAMGNIVSFIMFGLDRHNMMGMQGTFANGSAVPEFEQNTNMKNNVVEIKLGAENASEGYIKVNGQQIDAVLTRSQKDFPSGKAYVGLFFNNTTDFDFTCNTHVNAVAITAPQADSAYKMDLGKAQDFTLSIVNTSGKLTLTDESGNELPSTQFAYDGSKGTLTIKADYFSAKTFVKDGRIFIYDNERKTGTAFRMAYSNSDMGKGSFVFAAKGDLKDVTFDLGVSSVTAVMQNGEAISADSYTFADGKLTIKAAALKDEVGSQQFLVNAGGKLYPCYVYVDEFVNGVVLGSGATAIENGVSLAGKTRYSEAKVYDLTEGLKLGFDFKTIDGYSERGTNANATRFTLRLYDPASGKTIFVTLYPNYPDDKITTSTQALYVSYGLLNAEGGRLPGGDNRPAAPADGNNSASGRHNLELKSTAAGGLTLTVAGRPYSISQDVLDDFNLSAAILTLTTEDTSQGSVVELCFGGYGASENPGENPGTTPGENPGTNPGENPGTNPGDTGESNSGCGSVIGGYGWAIGLLVLLLGAGIVLIVSKKREK